VSVAGPVDPRTGWVIPPDRLDEIVRERVLARFDHRLLNDDPAFAARVPTAENIARVAHDALASAIGRCGGARLARVRVVETPRNAFEYEESR
jgi:6-pyruvoyltetrahydropterin/6-carboxytetrahydropterin synthase